METIAFYKRNNGSEAFLKHVGFHESGDYLCVWGFGTDDKPFRYNKHEFEQEFVLITEQEVNALERQRCGRRNEGMGSLEKEPLPDHWCKHANGDRTCSFCGSLHPEDVIRIIKEYGFGVLSRTDKGYKWYVNRPNVSNAMEGGIKYYRQHDTDLFVESFNKLISN